AAGAGCFSWPRIQPLSNGSSPVAWALAHDGTSAHSSIATAAIAFTRVFRVVASIVALPEIVEIEPVVRRIADMMFQPRRVTADERRDRGGALAAGDVDAFAERLEHQIVAVAAAIQAECQHH